MRQGTPFYRQTRTRRWLGPLVVVCSGCGGGYDASVSGVVTLDGQPVGPGVIAFYPESGGANPAIGGVDKQGVYRVETNGESGLNPGEYAVSVSIKRAPEPGEDPGARKNTMDLAHPDRYASKATSGLEYTIEPGANTIDIELTSGE